eukprot:snap_masked-scaffold_10-processed-gene-10.21-mRNA-1 protein AED:1.00 eAED:1.00 QI:0/0/0/0/1/1/3/0/60
MEYQYIKIVTQAYKFYLLLKVHNLTLLKYNLLTSPISDVPTSIPGSFIKDYNTGYILLFL